MIIEAASSLATVVNDVSPFALLVGAAAALLAYFKTQLTQKTIDNYKQYVESLEKDRDELTRRVTKLEADFLQVKAERDNLRTYVTGADAIKELARNQAASDAEVIGHLMAIEAMIAPALNTAMTANLPKPRVRTTKTATPRRKTS